MADVELLRATEATENTEQAFDFAKILKGIEEVVSDTFSFSTNASGAVRCEGRDDAQVGGDDCSFESIEKGTLYSRCNREDASVTTCSLSDLSNATDLKSLNRHVSWFDDEDNVCQEHSVEVKYIEIEKKTQLKNMLPNWNKKMCLNLKSAGKRAQRKMKNSME